MRTPRRLLAAFACGLLATGAAVPAALAQTTGGPPDDEAGPGVRFNGLGRAYIQQADLGGDVLDGDTTTAQTLADGEFVLDLAVAAQPNRATEVQGVVRLRNEFGGFFGAGVTVEVRELWARGVLGSAVEYRVGDMDYALTPFTVYLPEADGVVNPAEAFEPLRERIAYEEFYTGRNTRRLQGARVDFGLGFDQAVETADVRGFIARLRPTDFQNTPNRLIGGGRIGVTSVPLGPLASQLTAGVNLASTWDDLDSGDAREGIRNHVVTFDGALAILTDPGFSLALTGEGGYSIARFAEIQEIDGEDVEVDSLLRETDSFFEAGLRARLASGEVNAAAHFVNVGPDFFSVSAQSKRVDYTRALGQFNRVGNARLRRAIGLYDLSRDPGVYAFRPQQQLMRYDPRYGNVLPYGRATPNRRGLRVEADWTPEAGPFTTNLLIAALREIRGQGTEELKRFFLAQVGVDVPLAPLVGYARGLDLSLGVQAESTSRDGSEFETVDLTSFMLEAGVAAEVYDRLDVLLGAKARSSSGSDYVPQIENFNDVRDFPARFATDDGESLLAGGLRYRFGDDVYLTLQYQRYAYAADDAPEADYAIGQVFALYRMLF